MPYNNAPKNYEELFFLYSERVRKLTYAAAKRGGLRPDQAEDVAAVMFLKFIEKDIISWFDPAKGKFEHLITRFVTLHSRGVIESFQTKNNREHLADTSHETAYVDTPTVGSMQDVIELFCAGDEFLQRQLLGAMCKLIDLEFPVTILNLSVVTGWSSDDVKAVWGDVKGVVGTVYGRVA